MIGDIQAEILGWSVALCTAAGSIILLRTRYFVMKTSQYQAELKHLELQGAKRKGTILI